MNCMCGLGSAGKVMAPTRAPVSTRVGAVIGRRQRWQRRIIVRRRSGAIIRRRRKRRGSLALVSARAAEAAPQSIERRVLPAPRRERGRAAVQPRDLGIERSRRSGRGPPAAFAGWPTSCATASLSVAIQSASLCPSVPHSLTLRAGAAARQRVTSTKVSNLWASQFCSSFCICEGGESGCAFSCGGGQQAHQPAQAQHATSFGHSPSRTR